MMNVLNDEVIELPYVKKAKVVKREMMFSNINGLKIGSTNEQSIRKAYLSLVGSSRLRAAFIYEFRKGGAKLTIYEMDQDPISESEFKGVTVTVANGMKHNPRSQIINVSETSKSFCDSTIKIKEHLDRMDKNTNLFIVLFARNHLFYTGNMYSEHLLCRAMLDFKPRKSKTVISKVMETTLTPDRLQFLVDDDLYQPIIRKKRW